MIVSENVMGHLKYKWTPVGKGTFFFFLMESIYTSYLKNIKINVAPLNVSLKPIESISGQICQKSSHTESRGQVFSPHYVSVKPG